MTNQQSEPADANCVGKKYELITSHKND